ncbi:hypothetical protein J6590_076628 [Homalodisca vitripennis]|nr:hypothetical protein J6590_076628 [Homalodisca vitripennis]
MGPVTALPNSTTTNLIKTPSVQSVTSSKSDGMRPNRYNDVINSNDKAVNTPIYMDTQYQLNPLIEKCMSLQKSLDDKDNTGPDFQTQILLNELNKYKGENESLKTAITMLQEEITSFENKLQELTLLKGTCFNCFPPMQLSQSTSKSSASSLSTWTQVTQSNKKPSRPRSPLLPSALPCTNTFASLTVADEEGEEEDEMVNVENVQPEILICGDSHGRDLAYHLNKARKSNKAFGFIKPGGRSKDILNHENIEELNLKERDILVSVCGANDVAKNEALKNITDTLNKFSQMNIVLVNIPNRYDLAEWSVVNKEVRKTNKSPETLCRQHPNVTLVQAKKPTKKSPEQGLVASMVTDQQPIPPGCDDYEELEPRLPTPADLGNSEPPPADPHP